VEFAPRQNRSRFWRSRNQKAISSPPGCYEKFRARLQQYNNECCFKFALCWFVSVDTAIPGQAQARLLLGLSPLAPSPSPPPPPPTVAVKREPSEAHAHQLGLQQLPLALPLAQPLPQHPAPPHPGLLGHRPSAPYTTTGQWSDFHTPSAP